MKIRHNTYTVSDSSALMYAFDRRKEQERREKERREKWQKNSRIFLTGSAPASLFGKVQGTLAKAIYGLWKKGYFSQFPEFEKPGPQTQAVTPEQPVEELQPVWLEPEEHDA